MHLTRRRFLGLAVASSSALLAGCGRGGDSVKVDDPSSTAPAVERPTWFPKPFEPPQGGVLIDVIDKPEPGLGRTLTWRYDRSFDEVAAEVETILSGLTWVPTEVIETDGDAGAKRKSFFIENNVVYTIRVFKDDALSGVRMSVELPA